MQHICSYHTTCLDTTNKIWDSLSSTSLTWEACHPKPNTENKISDSKVERVAKCLLKEWKSSCHVTDTEKQQHKVTSGEISLSKACRNSSWSAWICSIFGFFTEFIIADEAGYTAPLALQLAPLIIWPEFCVWCSYRYYYRKTGGNTAC